VFLLFLSLPLCVFHHLNKYFGLSIYPFLLMCYYLPTPPPLSVSLSLSQRSRVFLLFLSLPLCVFHHLNKYFGLSIYPFLLISPYSSTAFLLSLPLSLSLSESSSFSRFMSLGYTLLVVRVSLFHYFCLCVGISVMSQSLSLCPSLFLSYQFHQPAAIMEHCIISNNLIF